jgi:hypothetical protein
MFYALRLNFAVLHGQSYMHKFFVYFAGKMEYLQKNQPQNFSRLQYLMANSESHTFE